MLQVNIVLLFSYSLVCHVTPNGGDFLTDLVTSCGDTVNSLFYDIPDNTNTPRCRIMRRAFACMKNNTSPSDWEFMVNTSQIATVDAKIIDTCEGESLRLCPRNDVQSRMQACYTEHLPSACPSTPSQWNCATIRHHLAIVDDVIECMREAITICPDDEFIAADLEALDVWATHAHNCSSLTATRNESTSEQALCGGCSSSAAHWSTLVYLLLILLPVC